MKKPSDRIRDAVLKEILNGADPCPGCIVRDLRITVQEMKIVLDQFYEEIQELKKK